MNTHTCFLCIGSNYYRTAYMTYARNDLMKHFPDIRFSPEMETEAIGDRFLSPFSNQVASFETALSAEEVRAILKQIESDHGRLPTDKSHGIVKMDIDLLMYDDCVLKPQDLERDFVVKGLNSLTL